MRAEIRQMILTHSADLEESKNEAVINTRDLNNEIHPVLVDDYSDSGDVTSFSLADI